MSEIKNTGFLMINTKVWISIIILLLFSNQIFGQSSSEPWSIETNYQLIVVVTDSPNLPDGKLFRYSKDNDSEWKSLSKPIPIIVGKNGLAESNGLIKIENLQLEKKEEGDKKSPAGIFTLSKAFGFAPPSVLVELKIPYLEIEEGIECIDDTNSEFYNIILQGKNAEKVDWRSSEKMWKADPWYRFGVIIDANNSPIIKGNGSCLFLHNWNGPDDETVGCTAMDSKAMKEIVLWLDSTKNPILVQLTMQQYKINQDKLGLPKIK